MCGLRNLESELVEDWHGDAGGLHNVFQSLLLGWNNELDDPGGVPAYSKAEWKRDDD